MYEPNSCNALAKVFYRPIEAAIRWCNLMDHETQILESASDDPALLLRNFPQWPCLYANTEKIFDAILHGELAYGCFGVPVAIGTPVDSSQLTVRHTELRLWMARYYPDQRPNFLFEQPHKQQGIISIGTYLALQADRDSLQLQIKKIEASYQQLINELEAIGIERENIHQLVQANSKLSDRSEIGYLKIIGALLELILGSSPSGKPHSVFNSQSSIVDSITAHYSGVTGLSKRSLDEKFAAGRRSLAQAKR
ncbi:hypothetical protein [Pseudomonas sp. Z18(2022)]|uniref:hypothetical protein n=1 Tax=Pseudomonas sp. Z18(2022) TaxID=2983410 RepID=UPI002E7FC8AE|nr:hypothetical protein [Pseudomonas sp. Z18(2022)]